MNPFSALGAKLFAGLSLALLLAVAFLWWRLDAKATALVEAQGDLRAAHAAIELLKLDAELKETASQEREADGADLRDQERELSDARTHQGDTADTRRIRRLCVILRQQGKDPNGYAPCRGLAGSAGT